MHKEGEKGILDSYDITVWGIREVTDLSNMMSLVHGRAEYKVSLSELTNANPKS